MAEIVDLRKVFFCSFFNRKGAKGEKTQKMTYNMEERIIMIKNPMKTEGDRTSVG
jgi:hypothetical protein